MRLADCVCGCSERYERHLLLRIFEEFNSIKNHELQNAYLRSRVRFSRYENLRNNQRRKIFTYELKINDLLVPVCRKFFLGVHGVTEARLRRKVSLKNDLNLF